MFNLKLNNYPNWPKQSNTSLFRFEECKSLRSETAFSSTMPFMNIAFSFAGIASNGVVTGSDSSKEKVLKCIKHGEPLQKNKQHLLLHLLHLAIHHRHHLGDNLSNVLWKIITEHWFNESVVGTHPVSTDPDRNCKSLRNVQVFETSSSADPVSMPCISRFA